MQKMEKGKELAQQDSRRALDALDDGDGLRRATSASALEGACSTTRGVCACLAAACSWCFSPQTPHNDLIGKDP